ncbi:hypothetical protein NN561_016917 [Cricetulus griseus]
MTSLNSPQPANSRAVRGKECRAGLRAAHAHPGQAGPPVHPERKLGCPRLARRDRCVERGPEVAGDTEGCTAR